jgi:PTH1 family peptidyl-tRNA hydrolase
MSDETLWMIVGLGNPGRKYAETRHNIGFMVIDRLADKYDISLTRNKFNSLFGTGEIDGIKVILSKPMAFMNRSGMPVIQLAKYYKLNLDQVLVIHDDIDIILKNLKVKSKGGHGGHNGIKSIIDAFGGKPFPRIRVGIGRPGEQIDVTNHVLGRFTADEMRHLEPVLSDATDAVLSILKKGIALSMNKFNRNVVGSDNL